MPELKPMLGRSGAALSGGQGKIAALGRAVMAGRRKDIPTHTLVLERGALEIDERSDVSNR
ncbi:MAG: hypothetical protein ABI310_03385 [Microbacteriaceae bacterium]